MRSPLSASRSTVGLSAASERSMVAIDGTDEAARSTPAGKKASMSGPGLKPSSVLHSLGSTRTPCTLAGMAASSKARRKPVGVLASGCRKTLEG